MVAATRLRSGYVTDSARAHAVAERFESAGVPIDSLAINDSEGRVVTVQEGTGADLSPDLFGAFMREANAHVNAPGDARFATDAETCVILPYGYVDNEIMSQNATPADAGANLADPSEVLDDDTFVFHNGGNRFCVLKESGAEDGADRLFVVDMDTSGSHGPSDAISVTSVFEGQPEASADETRMAVSAVVRAGPEFRPGPMERLELNVGNAGSAPSGGSSGSGSPDSASDVEPVSEPSGEYADDADSLIENVGEWLSNYTSVKSDMVDGWWELSFKRLTNPQNGNSEDGVLIELAPFAHSCWNNSDGEWASDEKKDEWTAHQEAVRSIFKEDDSPVTGFSVDTGEEYPDWYNYVPASEAADGL